MANPGGTHRVLGALLAAGLLGVVVEVGALDRMDELVLGSFFVPGLVAFTLSVLIARLLVPFVVRRLYGGEAAVAEQMRGDARLASPGAEEAFTRAGAEGTIAAGPSAIRNATALPLVPGLFAALFAGVIALNTAAAGGAETLRCVSKARQTGTSSWLAEIRCSRENGEELKGGGVFAGAPPPTTFDGIARRGFFGVWLLAPSGRARSD